MAKVWSEDYGDGSYAINIFKVESTLTVIQSFTFPHFQQSGAKIRSFSPITYHISILDNYKFRIFDIKNSKCLLDVKDHLPFHCFSPDGSLFAASYKSGVHIWKYVSGHYTLKGVFQCQGLSNSPQFSPTLLSILGHSRDILWVLHLHEFSTVPETHHWQYAGLLHSGTHIATAYKGRSTVIITNLLAQTPSQFIDTGMSIEGLVLTGNILLVADSARLVAWLLTEEGLVDGVIGDRRVDYSDSIWTVTAQVPHSTSWMFHVEGQVGVIEPYGHAQHIYHTETGEVLHPTQALQHFSSHQCLSGAHSGKDCFCYHNLPQCNAPPEDSWQTSQATLQEGWVKDPEGKHRLWVPIEWRADWDPADWHHDTTTQFNLIRGRPVLVKF